MRTVSEVWNNIFHTEAPSRSASSRSWSWVLSLNGILLDASSILGFHWSNPSAKMDGWGNRGQSRKICKPCETLFFFGGVEKRDKGDICTLNQATKMNQAQNAAKNLRDHFFTQRANYTRWFSHFRIFGLESPMFFFWFSAMLGRQVGDTTEGFKAAGKMGIFYQKSLSNCSFWGQNVLERCHVFWFVNTQNRVLYIYIYMI